jgi:transposase
MDEFRQPLRAPTVLVLAKASLHKALLGRARHREWAARGLRRLLLPPYSPDLNKLERLWLRGKHYGVRPEDDQTAWLKVWYKC